MKKQAKTACFSYKIIQFIHSRPKKHLKSLFHQKEPSFSPVGKTNLRVAQRFIQLSQDTNYPIDKFYFAP